MVLPIKVFAALTVWTAGLEVVAEGALSGVVAGVAASPVVGLTTVAVLVLVLDRVLVMFP